MVSDDPMGPYTYVGEILQNPSYYFNVGGNNHHALFEFNGTTYITYHAQTLGKALGIEKGYRSTHINEVEYTMKTAPSNPLTRTWQVFPS